MESGKQPIVLHKFILVIHNLLQVFKVDSKNHKGLSDLLKWLVIKSLAVFC